jgi:bifunctional UDP-N-acetylglucosamine pyrophosphorylase/glucosamine-1-phosphate N-acetyltransferase
MKQKNIPTKETQFAVILEEEVQVHSFNYITNNTQIGKKTIIEPYNQIKHTQVGQNCVINSSKLQQSNIQNNVIIGPNAHLRPKSNIQNNAKIGNFVEVKNSVVGEGSKVSHMSYIGDGLIGKHCNIGCGTIFCNFDGKKKHQTKLDDNVFIGSNVNLVAPIHIKKNALVGAGSTLVSDVPKNALSIARARQIVKPNYYKGR